MPLFKIAAVASLLLLANVNAFAPSRPLGRSVSTLPNAEARSASYKGAKTSLFMSSRNQTGRDFYKILGIQRGADDKEIKAAYRNLARKFHPGMKI
jgi:DnaJ-domain-containing protein 1